MWEGNVLSWFLGNKSIYWFQSYNKYLLVAKPANQVLNLLIDNYNPNIAVSYLIKESKLSRTDAEALVENVIHFFKQNFSEEKPDNNKDKIKEESDIAPEKCKIEKYYRINKTEFLFEYSSDALLALIHPKFAQFEIEKATSSYHLFEVLGTSEPFSLKVNNRLIGKWNDTETHFLAGKCSMQVLQKIYHSDENNWMGIFHAAGISNGKKCLMFLGDSGSGKSTLSALLMAEGLQVLSDDFLPVEKETAMVCRFPASISIKKGALKLLANKFPGLEKATEYHQYWSGKIFRFLPVSDDSLLKVPCVGLVFVVYEKGVGFKLDKMPADEAFQKLVPDTWIAPDANSANRFVDWFKSMPCYRMVYSDNEKMVQEVFNLLEQ